MWQYAGAALSIMAHFKLNSERYFVSKSLMLTSTACVAPKYRHSAECRSASSGGTRRWPHPPRPPSHRSHRPPVAREKRCKNQKLHTRWARGVDITRKLGRSPPSAAWVAVSFGVASLASLILLMLRSMLLLFLLQMLLLLF